MNSRPWPAMLPVRNVRFARPTDQLDEVVRSYREGLGPPELDRFAGHVGYRGVLLGLPGTQYHLEFTQHDQGSRVRRPAATTCSCSISTIRPNGPGCHPAGHARPPAGGGGESLLDPERRGPHRGPGSLAGRAHAAVASEGTNAAGVIALRSGGSDAYGRPGLSASWPDVGSGQLSVAFAGRKQCLSRAKSHTLALSWCFRCSSGRSPVLADQAVDDVGALDPGLISIGWPRWLMASLRCTTPMATGSRSTRDC
jgi:YycE-like N-terminal domain